MTERKIIWENMLNFIGNMFLFAYCVMMALGILWGELKIGKPIGYWSALGVSVPLVFFMDTSPWKRIAIVKYEKKDD